MHRRQVLKRSVAAISFTGFLAGCSGDSNNSNETATITETEQYPDEPREVGGSGMQRDFDANFLNLELLAVEEVEVTDTEITLDITLRNETDQDVLLHTLSIAIYLFKSEEPTEDQQIGYTGTSPEFDRDQMEPTPPGEVETLRYSTQVPNSSDATIQSYRVLIDCDPTADYPGC